MASVTPVVDGFVLRKGMCSILLITGVKWILHEPFSFSGLVYSALPELVQAHARHVLVTPNPTRHGIELLPHQLIASKLVSSFNDLALCVVLIYIFFDKPVEPGAPPRYTHRADRIAGTTESWRAWCEAREIDEWIQSVAGVLDQGWNEQFSSFFFLCVFPFLQFFFFKIKGSFESTTETIRVPYRLQHLLWTRTILRRRTILLPLSSITSANLNFKKKPSLMK